MKLRNSAILHKNISQIQWYVTFFNPAFRNRKTFKLPLSGITHIFYLATYVSSWICSLSFTGDFLLNATVVIEHLRDLLRKFPRRNNQNIVIIIYAKLAIRSSDNRVSPKLSECVITDTHVISSSSLT